jgi:hypothetical protein
MQKSCVPKWLLSFGLLWLANAAAAQDPTCLLDWADRLAAKGWHDSARHEYRRWLFFAEDPVAAAPVWFRLGQLEEQANNPEAARQAYQRCQLTTSDHKLSRLVASRAGFCSLLMNRFAEGHFHLLPAIDLQDSIGRQAAWLDILCLIGMGAYSEARAVAHDLYQSQCSIAIHLDSCFSAAQRIQFRSESKAQWLSLVPGLGLMYAGAWSEGLRSLGLTGGAASVAVLAFSNQLYWVGILSGVVVAQRFYEGGARLAAQETERRNTRKREQIRKDLQQELLRVSVAGLAAKGNAPE